MHFFTVKTRICLFLLLLLGTACEQTDVRERLSLTDLSGNPYTNLGNDYLLVNFWATWCAPCIEEMPSLEKAQQLLPANIKIILVSGEDLSKIRSFREKYDIHLPMYQMENSIEEFQLQFLPTTLLISPDGDLLMVEEGERVWDNPDMIQQISDAMN